VTGAAKAAVTLQEGRNFMRLAESSRRGFIVATILAALTLAMLAVACGSDDDDDPAVTPTGAASEEPTDAPTGGFDYESLSGEIRIDGSSTVFPISEAMAEEFRSAAPDVRVNVAFSGTGGGFELFCRGEIQVADASRPINEEEVQACADAGIDDVVEVRVATDALAVVVNPENTWATCMTVDQLYTAFNSEGATTWADIDPSWPNDEIVFYYPGTDSGTFDYFVEAVIEEVGGETGAHRGDGTASEDDNVLALGVEGDTNAIGYFGFAYFQGAGDAIAAVEVDGGAGCVAPSLETALDGTYRPLSRPLFIYTRESYLAENPEVLGFVHFYLANANVISEEVGYVPLPEDALNAQVDKIEPYLP
jgi:phosphate transport system substrate-binding protein